MDRNTSQSVEYILIEGLKVPAVIGVHAWEKHIQQNLYLDLKLSCDFSAAIASDQIEDALDYASVSQFIQNWISKSRFQLLETLAHGLADTLLEQFMINQVQLSIKKQRPLPDVAWLGVELTRTKA